MLALRKAYEMVIEDILENSNGGIDEDVLDMVATDNDVLAKLLTENDYFLEDVVTALEDIVNDRLEDFL